MHRCSGMDNSHSSIRVINQTISIRFTIDDSQPLFQSVNKASTALSGRALNRYNAWAAIRKQVRNAGLLYAGLGPQLARDWCNERFTWRMEAGSSMPSRWPA
jgi:hypothetical protein